MNRSSNHQHPGRLTLDLHQCMILAMTRTQIQLPDPLYRRLKQVASANDWSLAEVIRRAAELYVQRFPSSEANASWVFPMVDAGGDFLVDPADFRAEAESIVLRSSE